MFLVRYPSRIDETNRDTQISSRLLAQTSAAWRVLFVAAIHYFSVTAGFAQTSGNRLTYLDQSDPYYVSLEFPKLTTPQWVGEPGVETVVVLAIDDMRGLGKDGDKGLLKYENYLRPILERLKKIDGRAPVSIMTNRIEPNNARLAQWLKEGLSLDCHTYDHPCPLLKERDFAKAKGTYDRCIDMMFEIKNNRPVAFRMPCCDSLNTVSPRFFAEIFNRVTEKGRFLTIDSSVFHVPTSDDPALPRSLVVDADGQDKFLKYDPRGRGFANTIYDYPYPYVIGRLCWELPCAMPSDWSAQHYQQPFNPRTVRDWMSQLDATVMKRGTMTMVFHPHGWIRNAQMIELIDHAVRRHGNKVKFLTFAEVERRLNEHLLAGHPLRAANGQDNGIRILDVNNDGYVDVLIGNEKAQVTRLWSPADKTWKETPLPVRFVTPDKDGNARDTGIRFGVLSADGSASMIRRNAAAQGGWHFQGGTWVRDDTLLDGLSLQGIPLHTSKDGRDLGVRLRDLDTDGIGELIVSNPRQSAIYSRDRKKKTWTRLPFRLPENVQLVDAEGRDAGLRFVDLNDDGKDDVLFSSEKHHGVYLFSSLQEGWSRHVADGADSKSIPSFVRFGTNNGAWFHARHLVVQNEDTAHMKHLVERRSFSELLGKIEPLPKSPTESLMALKARPGFRVELVAAEPLIADPVAFDFGHDGKLWVVEMADYPLGIDGQGKFGGRVRYLEDENGDGKYDKSTLFLEGLGFPNGIIAWRKGVLVSAPPEIFYAEDTDGDGKADVRRSLFKGFREANQQHRTNGFWWGLDNWLYCAGGTNEGSILSVKTGKKTPIGKRDFRIRPDTGLIDPQTGQTQFARARDEWGSWFGSSNSNPAYHFVLADHYLRRNPHLRAPDPRHNVSEAPGAAPVFPRSRTLARFNDLSKANRFTSACGLCIYNDDLFGASYRGNSFVCEPVHNLVHREVVVPDGVTFSSRRAADETESEFLASTDNWFRPTMARTGPDGALWVADMYRHVIEHPEWIPAQWQKKLDLRAGHDRGRIYRIVPVGKKLHTTPALNQLSVKQLVALFESPNATQRDMAQRVLIWKRDKSSLPLLEQMALQNELPTARLHAICTLDGLAALTPDVLIKLIPHPHPGIRRHAVRLAESRLEKHARLGPALLDLVGDKDPQVAMQLACTLGAWNDPRAGRALGQLATAHAHDPYLSAAAMSSALPNLDQMVSAVLQEPSGPPPALVKQLLGMATSVGNRRAAARFLEAIARPQASKQHAPWQMAALGDFLDALDRRSMTLAKYRQGADDGLKRSLDLLEEMFAAARTVAAHDAAPLGGRIAAARLLARGSNNREKDLASLGSLLVPQSPLELQKAVILALGRLRDKSVPQLLLKRWTGYGPSLREEILDVLFARTERLSHLLGAIESEQLLVSDLSAARRQLLLAHRDAGIRSRAAKLLTGSSNPSRAKVLADYRGVLSMQGDTKRGEQVYAKRCATCHRLKEKGHPVGPDLSALTDKSAQAMLTAIFDPNKAVEAKYKNYIALTADGRTLSGLLSAETGGSIELLAAEGKRHVIARADLDEFQSTGKSLMPEGLEKDLKPSEVADVIAYIGAFRPPRRKFDGNQPEVVRPEALRGEYWLLSRQAEIYGKTIVFEKKYGNLGYWQSPADHAVWTIDVVKPGNFQVSIDYACPANSSGNRLVLEAAGKRLGATVRSTSSWDAYRVMQLGTLRLPAGRHRIAIRAEGNIKGALLDLKAVRLRPVKK